MRSRLGAFFVVVVLALAGVGLFGAPAGAQTFSCSYTVGPTTLPPGGGFVTVQGTAPGGATVSVFVNGSLAGTVLADSGTGFWAIQVFLTGSAEVSVSLGEYPNTPCIGSGDTTVGQGSPGGTVTGRLPRTGSSGTEPLVLAGFGALALGAVLVVAARRRAEVRGRA